MDPSYRSPICSRSTRSPTSTARWRTAPPGATKASRAGTTGCASSAGRATSSSRRPPPPSTSSTTRRPTSATSSTTCASSWRSPSPATRPSSSRRCCCWASPASARPISRKRLAHVLGTGFEFVSMSSLTAGWVLTGASAQWHNARPGKVAQTLIEGEYANPVVVLDEVDKAGGDRALRPDGRAVRAARARHRGPLQGRVHRRRHGRVAHPVGRHGERRKLDSRADPEPHEHLRDRAAGRRRLAPDRARRLSRDPRRAPLAVPAGAVARACSSGSRRFRRATCASCCSTRSAPRSSPAAIIWCPRTSTPQALRPQGARRLLTRRRRRAGLPTLRAASSCAAAATARGRRARAAGLAARAVVALVVGVDDPLHRSAAHRARLAEACRARPSRGRNAVTFSGKASPASRAQPLGPFARAPSRVGVEQPRESRASSSFARMRDRRQLRAMQDLVRVRVADAAEEMRIGQRALQRVVLAQRARARSAARSASSTSRPPMSNARQRRRAVHDVQRRAPLGARLGQRERAVGESKRASVMRPGGFASARQPAQAAGDHQVDDEEEVAVERHDDALAEATHVDDALPSASPIGGIAVRSTNGLTMPHAHAAARRDARVQRFAVDDDVGQLRHRATPASPAARVACGKSPGNIVVVEPVTAPAWRRCACAAR